MTTILDPKQAPGQCPLARLNLQCVAKSDIGLLETQDIALLETQDIALLKTQATAPVETQDIALVETQDIALVEIQDIPPVETQDIALLEAKDIALLGSESDSGGGHPRTFYFDQVKSFRKTFCLVEGQITGDETKQRFSDNLLFGNLRHVSCYFL